MDSVSSVQQKRDYSRQITQLNTQISQLEGKKDKLLELSIANAITIQEFKKRNNRFNEQIADMQEQMISLQKLEENGSATSVDLSAIEKSALAGAFLSGYHLDGGCCGDPRPCGCLRGQHKTAN